MSPRPSRWRRAARGLAAAALLACTGARAEPELPPEVEAALQRARVPAGALAVVVQEAGSGRSVYTRQPGTPVNPASLAKLVTTYAALDLLGPAWTWSTPVWLAGPVRDGTLEGDLVIKGSGDPTLVLERVWLLLRRVQQLGVSTIGGDIVLDASAFHALPTTPGDFDGERLRAYNVQPDALLLNFKSVTYSFVPDAARGVAHVISEPRLPEAPERTVPLAPGPCGDWRAALQPRDDRGRLRFAGTYPGACGEQSWVTADPRPDTYNGRMLVALWQEMGGRLAGTVREGRAPADRSPSFELRSPPLAQVIRDINKFSNNVMSQQLFLTLAPGRPAGNAAARERVTRWLRERLGDAAGETPFDDAVIDNGSGLSREYRISARMLARLLQQAGSSAVMPELMGSLPIVGIDGTLRRARATPGRAHLKTGSLRDVAGLAGWVLSDSGRRYVLVAIVNHPNASAARPALDALVGWVLRDAPGR